MRSRGEFENVEPIDDPLIVLDLLCRRWGDSTVRELDRRFDDGPFVQITHCQDFGYDTVYRFKVTDRVANELLKMYLVAGKPEWGYTDMKRLRITDGGECRLWDVRKAVDAEDRLTAEWWYRRVA